MKSLRRGVRARPCVRVLSLALVVVFCSTCSGGAETTGQADSAPLDGVSPDTELPKQPDVHAELLTDTPGTDLPSTDHGADDAGDDDGHDAVTSDSAEASDLITELDAADATDTAPGPCQSADECPAGQGCRDPGEYGVCEPCRVADECRPGEACDALGVCGPCSDDDAPACSGMLCVDDACAPCTPGLHDANCVAGYGEGAFCAEGGRCTRSCTATVDCLPIGALCDTVDNTCVLCDSSEHCVAGGYALGTPCIAGVCVEASCDLDADCVAKLPERPICGSDRHCRACGTDSECLSALGELAICTQGGTCAPGVCGGLAGSICAGGNAGLVCKDYHCVPCVDPDDDALCRAQVGDSFACISGICVKDGVHGQPACDPYGTVYAPPLCVACSFVAAPDSACVTAYNEPRLCQGDVCVPGECRLPSECEAPGSLCTNLFCTSCAEAGDAADAHDAACREGYGDAAYICEAGACALGCSAAADCGRRAGRGSVSGASVV